MIKHVIEEMSYSDENIIDKIKMLNVSEGSGSRRDIIKKKDINSGKYLLKNRKDIKLSKLVNIFNKLNKKKLKIHWNSRKIIKQKIYSYKKLKGWKPIKSNIVDIINIIKN